jgi:hypothetical protein
MKAADIVERCQQLLQQFDPVIMTVDSYAKQALGDDCEGKVSTLIV